MSYKQPSTVFSSIYVMKYIVKYLETQDLAALSSM